MGHIKGKVIQSSKNHERPSRFNAQIEVFLNESNLTRYLGKSRSHEIFTGTTHNWG